MRTTSVDEVIRSIDDLSAVEPGGALAFDGDGTLWSGDIGEDFYEAMLAHGLDAAARPGLAREAAEAGLDASGTANELAHRLHEAYLAGRFDEERICEIITWLPAGWTRDHLDRFAAATIEAVGLARRLHREALRVVEHAARAGIDVFLVSASPRAVVDAAARVVGIDLARVTAVNERVGPDGIVECAVVRPITYGAGKVTRLREKLGRSRILYAAFGDNAFDVPLLLEARVPVAIRPKARLLDRAGEVPNLVVLERQEV